jgi:guanylate kinase
MNGKAVIFSAPSGSGKTTIVHHLLSTMQQLAFSVSATTRPIRGTEIHGKDYYFLALEEFKQKISENAFVEFEEVYENRFYGTLKSEVEQLWNDDKVVLFDVDVVGGIQLKKYFGDAALSIFVKPPSLAELRKRLELRKTDKPEDIKKRIEKATFELGFEKDFDVILINDEIELTFAQAEKLVSTFLKSNT